MHTPLISSTLGQSGLVYLNGSKMEGWKHAQYTKYVIMEKMCVCVSSIKAGSDYWDIQTGIDVRG